MTRSLAISARQVTAICKGAAKAGFVAELVINGVTVRLVPSDASKAAKDFDENESSTFTRLAQYYDRASRDRQPDRVKRRKGTL